MHKYSKCKIYVRVYTVYINIHTFMHLEYAFGKYKYISKLLIYLHYIYSSGKN